jgi:CysZ protein
MLAHTQPTHAAPLARTDNRLRIADGASAFFRGIGFVISRPSVWLYAIVPVLVLCALIVSIAALGFWGASALAHALLAGSGALSEVGRVSMQVILDAVIALVALLAGFAFAQPLSGFALEAISEKQSLALGGARHPKPLFFDNMKRSIAVNLLGLMVGIPIFVVLTIIELFAPPAVVVTWPLKFVLSALLLAWDLLDYPLGLRATSISARLAFIRHNFMAVLVFGAFGAIVLLVPGFGLLLLPFGVAGATRLACRAERA